MTTIDLCAGDLPAYISIRFILQGRPQRPVRNSFDHLVGAGEQRRRHLEVDQTGRLGVDD